MLWLFVYKEYGENSRYRKEKDMAMITNDWANALSEEFKKPYYRELYNFVKEEYASTTVYPPAEDIFNALHYENIQMGYACFFYSELNYGNCLKVAQIAIFLSTALGGYRDARFA